MTYLKDNGPGCGLVRALDWCLDLFWGPGDKET